MREKVLPAMILPLRAVVARVEEICRLYDYSSVYLIVDESTERYCLPLLLDADERGFLTDVPILVLPQGERAKTIEASVSLWHSLSQHGANRRSLLCALGGGAITDMVGWIASTYMRGIGLIHIPTSLLGAVDAAIGGKCAIDLGALKNMVGTFYSAIQTLITTSFYHTLPESELLSGYGEVLKYGLLEGEPLLSDVLRYAPIHLLESDDLLASIVQRCVVHKESVIAIDPYDRGVRKYLNLGHTIGHALEGYLMSVGRPIPHGVAVAAGLLAELYLACQRQGQSHDLLYRYGTYLRDYYPAVFFTCDEYDAIYDLATRDKKNERRGNMSMVLLSGTGQPNLVTDISKEEFFESLDFYRDFLRV